jgi:hypothetical protein
MKAGCHRDTDGWATYLDMLLMQDPNANANSTAAIKNGRKPLANVHLIGTASTPSYIHRIEYMFADDDLESEDSKLHKALIAKYGPPLTIHSGKMKWKVDSTELIAECEPSQACQIMVEDDKYRDIVEGEQREADAKQKRDAAPAPQL